MNNTYTQIHIQAVFAVKYRESLISSEWKRRLYQYMIAIINDQGHKTLAIGGTANHLHILFGFRPTQSLSSLMLRVKRESSEWINKEHLTKENSSGKKGMGHFHILKKICQPLFNIFKIKRFITKRNHLEKNILNF